MIKFKNIYAIPSFHSRIQFANEVRKTFFKIKPDVIAVEIPSALKEKVIEGIKRLPYISIIGYKAEGKNKFSYVPIDPGDSIIEAVRLGIEHNIPVEFIDLDVTRYRQRPFYFRFFNEYMIEKIGLAKFYESVKGFIKKSNPDTKDYNRERFLAQNLKKLMNKHEKVLFVCGMAHWERIRGFLKRQTKKMKQSVKREEIEVFNLSKNSFREVLRELPYVTYLYEMTRKDITGPNDSFFDKLDAYKKIYLESKDIYYKDFGENISIHEMKIIFQFARNYGLMENEFIPNLYHLVMSAKCTHDDDYAAVVYDLAITYPPYKKDDKYREIEIKRRKGFLGERVINLRRRLPVGEMDKRKIPIKKRPKEQRDGEWRDQWEDDYRGIFSYPPEDVKFENYMDFMRKKALKTLLEENVKIEEFKTSILDGISIKETLRNWHVDQKIYVREELQLQGEIGPVVVIFEEDDTLDKKYNYQMNWIHEHENESDLLLYSTSPGVNIIGPGISRGEFGGFISIFPPLDYTPYLIKDFSRYYRKSERLLLNAINYATEKQKYIIYVANKRPDPYFKSVASKEGKYIVYISLSQFNPKSIKKLRILHFLNSKAARNGANKFIFL